jgi:hypothetical protein
LRELEPLIEEHAQVRKALDALKGAGTSAQRVATTAPKRLRSAKTGTATRGPGRPRGTGRRAQEALKLVHKHPGITIAEMAKRMKRDAHADPDYRRRRHRPVAAGELEPRAALGVVAALMLAQVTGGSFATSVLATGRGTSQVLGRTHADRRNTHGDAV